MRIMATVLVGFLGVGAAFAAGYKGIHIGEDASDLPEALRGDGMYANGNYRGAWFVIDVFGGKVNRFDVIYVGKSFDRKTTIAQEISLASAIKEHSLQPDMAQPIFGYAVDRDGATYGLVDVQNRISYHVSPIAEDSRVDEVSYLSDDAPVLESAKRRLFERPKSVALLGKARTARAFEPSPGGTKVEIPPSMERVEQTFKTSTRDDAIRIISEQNDVVMGKAQRTLALIQEVSTWYEVDSTHPTALAKSRELRDFYSSFREEYGKLALAYRANESLFRDRDILLLEESQGAEKEIESKMRRLKAMGFQ